MPTQRLYLDDSHLLRFTARVVAVRPGAVVLDRSAFYPEGGGQPGDRGTLGGLSITDTQDEAGEVVHRFDGETSLAVGADVEGVVDAARRHDHLQQHHGQHLLSAAFQRALGAETRSFHLGAETCTIDLDCSISKLDEVSLRAAEALANETIWRDLEVHARDVVGDARAKLPLRKEGVKGDRVVWVEGVDASPCGGTHPRRTGEVGSVAVLSAQKWGQGQARVEFVCGKRVVSQLGQARATLGAAAKALGSNLAEVGAQAARLAAESLARKKSLEALLADHAKLLAAQLAAAQPGAVVAEVERGAALAKPVALALAAQGRTACIASVDEGRAHVVLARPRGPGVDLGALLKEALALLGGKGGGSPDLAQGRGAPEKLPDALALVRTRLG